MKHVSIVGGGIAGLTAACLLARSKHRVTLFEKKLDLGGRAGTERHEGFQVNLGAHALYRSGALRRTLSELGLEISGSTPPLSHNFGSTERGLHALPGGPVSLLSTDLLSLSSKLELARILAQVMSADPTALPEALTVRAFIEARAKNEDTRALLHALFRVSCYADAPERMAARAHVLQLQRALRHNVLYVDGGWQQLTRGLHQRALDLGVTIERQQRVERIEHGANVRAVRLADGRSVPTDVVLLATPPRDAAALVPDNTALSSWASELTPIHAATLDVCLASLPNPRLRFVLGVARPTYYSVHSLTAKDLAPPGGAMIHLLRYGPEVEDGDERELEALLDAYQPGWRDVLVWRRFLPRITVAHALVEVGRPGPGPAVPGVRGLYVAGDWAGEEGMLADRAAASAGLAARMIEGWDEHAATVDRRDQLSVA